MYRGGGGGGGGGDMSFLSISCENGQRIILKNYFWVFLSNSKIVYYQDVPQLPVPLNTLLVQSF